MVLNLGSVNFDFTVNTATLDKANASLKRLRDSVDSAAKAGKGLGGSFQPLLRQEKALTAATAKYERYVLAVQRSTLADKDKIEAISRLNRALGFFQNAVSRGAISTQAFFRAQNQFNQTLNKVQQATSPTGRGIEALSNKMTDLAKAVQVALGPLSGVASRITAITALANRQTVAIAGLIGGIIAFGGVTYKAILLGRDYEVALKQLENRVKSLGESFGFTAAQLDAMARKLGRDTLASAQEARKAILVLTTVTGLSGDNFERALDLAQDLTDTGFRNLTTNARTLARVLQDPALAGESLRQFGVSLSFVEKRMLETFQAIGDVGKAQSLILDRVFERVGDNSRAASDTFAFAFDTMLERMKEFLENAITLSGAMDTLKDQINGITARLEDYNNRLGVAVKFGKLMEAGIFGLVGGLRGLVEILDFLILGLLGLIGGKLLQLLIRGFVTIIKNVTAAGRAVKFFFGAFAGGGVVKAFAGMISPLSRVIVLLGALAGVLAAIVLRFETAQGKAERFLETGKRMAEELKAGTGSFLKEDIEAQVLDSIKAIEQFKKRYLEVYAEINKMQASGAADDAFMPGPVYMLGKTKTEGIEELERLKKLINEAVDNIITLRAEIGKLQKASDGYDVGRLITSLGELAEETGATQGEIRKLREAHSWIQRAAAILSGSFVIPAEKVKELRDALKDLVPSAKNWVEALREIEKRLESSGLEFEIESLRALTEAYSKGWREVEKTEEQLRILERLISAELVPAYTTLATLQEQLNELTREQGLEAVKAANIINDTKTEIRGERDLELIKDVINESKTPLDEYIERMERLQDLLQRRPDLHAEIAQAMGNAREELIKTTPVLRDLWNGFNRLADGIVASMQKGADAMEIFRDIALNVINDILEAIIQMAIIAPLMNSLFGTAVPGLGSFTGPLSMLFGMGGGIGGAGGAANIPVGIGDPFFGLGGSSAGPINLIGSSFFGFAQGGAFTVGGTGGVDSQLVQFMASPGEHVEVTPRGKEKGGTTIIMDLRGSNGDAAIEEAVRRGIQNASPSIIATSVRKVQSERSRTPTFFGGSGRR